MSAYEALDGEFDYNKTPLCPFGTKALIYDAPIRRTMWAPHTLDGWHLGPAMQYYRCGQYFINSTRATTIASSTHHFSAHYEMPTISADNNTLIVAAELAKLVDQGLSGNTRQKVKHAKIMQQITEILKDGPPQRVDQCQPQRVNVP